MAKRKHSRKIATPSEFFSNNQGKVSVYPDRKERVIMNVEEYRSILNDYKSSEIQIKKRLQFLESFFRNIAKIEIENSIKIQKITHE